MPKRHHVDDLMLDKLLAAGYTQAEAARKLGVTPAAICRRMQKMTGRPTLESIVRQAVDETPEWQIGMPAELKEINNNAREMLAELIKDIKGGEQINQAKAGLSLKIMAEIRAQMHLALEIDEARDKREHEVEFREEVINAIGTVAPEAKRQIIERIQERNSVRRPAEYPEPGVQ